MTSETTNNQRSSLKSIIQEPIVAKQGAQHHQCTNCVYEGKRTPLFPPLVRHFQVSLKIIMDYKLPCGEFYSTYIVQTVLYLASKIEDHDKKTPLIIRKWQCGEDAMQCGESFWEIINQSNTLSYFLTLKAVHKG